MDRGSKARIETAVVAFFLILLLITVPLMYFALEAPLLLVLGVAICYLIVAYSCSSTQGRGSRR